MRAARIHNFGPPDVIVIDDLPRPIPAQGQLLVRVAAAGVGPWDALIREHKSVVNTPLPLILGADLSGVVEEVGPGVLDFKVGDPVYGANNPNFCGAYTDYALAFANMVARKPAGLTDVEAASVPVVAVTAWQMLFDYAQAKAGQTVLIHGGAGSVGAYAVQLASRADLRVIATASAADASFVQSLGAEDEISAVDIVIDTVGGDIRERSVKVLKPGGILVSVVSPFPKTPDALGVRAAFFIVAVTTVRLNALAELFDQRKLAPSVGTVLPLEQVRTAHEMLAGAPHKRGKIVLAVAAAV